MDTRVNALLPLTVSDARVATSICLEGFGEGHRLSAAATISANALCAVRLPVWDSNSTVVHKGVRRKHQFYLPVCVGAVEHLDFETTVLGYIFLNYKNAALVSHITRG